MVIHHHKNDHKGKKIIDIFDDELVECLRKGLYQSSSAFTKMFDNEFDDYTPYD
jgi:hypothetical protein